MRPGIADAAGRDRGAFFGEALHQVGETLTDLAEQVLVAEMDAVEARYRKSDSPTPPSDSGTARPTMPFARAAVQAARSTRRCSSHSS